MTNGQVRSQRGPFGRSSSEVGKAFTRGEFPVAVYGLGKMGLPLASVFAEVSGNVTGVDVDSDVVETVNSGGCHVKREPGLSALVEELVTNDDFVATTDSKQAAQEAAIHVVIVPTPITATQEPDLSILDDVIRDIGGGLSPGDLVVIECTVPPTTTQDRVQETLLECSGLDSDDFGLAFCPERTASGRALEDIRGAYPKIVGGVDYESTAVAAAIYEAINASGVISVADATTAECVKVFEGLYRDVNIALANELATFTDEIGVDIREAIDVANTQPYCDIHDPGPGVGGHCIPFYPYFMIEPFETAAPLLETARAVNDGMPSYTVEKVREELEAEGNSLPDASVILLGLTYRPGVEEIRASPAIDIASELAEEGATVFGVDPMLDEFEAFALQPMELSEIYGQSFDAVVLVTPHEEFEAIEWEQIHRENEQLIVIDGRDTLELDETDHRLYTLGRGIDV